MTPPQDYETLHEEIASRRETLSKRLQEIAKFALDHPTDMALKTIAIIAQSAEVQPSALIRFAKAFGYSGFSEMQRAFQSRVVERSASYKERVRTLQTEDLEGKPGLTRQLLTQYCAANIVSLEELRDNAAEDDLEAATDLLANADNIYIVAQRRSFPVAAYLGYAFNHADCRAHLLDNIGGMLNEQAQPMSDKDVLIAISFSPYAPETGKVVDIASKKNVPIIAITDSEFSPIAPAAQVCLKVHDAEVHSFRSLTASMCLALTLVTTLAFRKP